MTASLSELSRVAEQLNKESAKVNAIISRVNESLAGMNIGVEVWLDKLDQFLWIDDPRNDVTASTQCMAEQLGYGLTEDRWQLAVRLVEVREAERKNVTEYDVLNAHASRPLIKTSRNLRIASLELLPTLTESIKHRLESMIASIAKSAAATLVIVRAEDCERPVEELGVSVRTYNCLKNANIQTIGELVVSTEEDLLRTKNFGRTSLNEIKDLLASLGYSLGMKYDIEGNIVRPELA